MALDHKIVRTPSKESSALHSASGKRGKRTCKKKGGGGRSVKKWEEEKTANPIKKFQQHITTA